MVEETGDLELGDGLPKGKLQESFYGVRMREWELDRMVSDPQDGCPGCPYIEFGAGRIQRRMFSRPKGREPEGGPS